MVKLGGRAINIGLSVLFGIIAVFLILRIWRYLRNELKTAPRQRIRDRFWITFSMLLFSVILTAVILFIAAMISSTVISNRAYLGKQGILSLLDPQLINAFEFPLLLPSTLVGLGIFIVIYPFGELFYMGQKTNDGAMEIQKWVEKNIIDRFQPPWSYMVGILTFFVIYLIPPYLITRLLPVMYSSVGSDMLNHPLSIYFVFLDWFMLFPIIYLTYYATIGTSQALFIGLKRNLRKAERKRIFYLITAFIAIITTILNLINYIPLLFRPGSLTTEISQAGEGAIGFLQREIGRLLNTVFGQGAEDIWYLFSIVVPLDLFIFFLSTMIFALVGFFSKFLNKEPLNRPILVLFAANILCGIPFQIFGFIITKWPWVFPVQNAYFSIPAIDVNTARIFIPAVTIDKIFMAIFLIYQLFFNKNLRQTVNELSISQAIADKEVKVLLKYAHNKDSRIRRLVLEAVGHICETYPDEIEDFLSVFYELAGDHDSEVIRAIGPAVKFISFRGTPENLVPILQIAFGTEQDVSISEMQKVLLELGRTNPEKVQSIYENLYEGYLPDKAKDAMVSVLHTLGDIFPELSYNIAIPLLERKTLRIRQGAMQIIKNLIHDFKPKFRSLYDKMKEIADNRKEPLRGAAIEAMAYICSVNGAYIDEFLHDYKEFIGLEDEDLKQVIGGLTQIIISFPEYIDRVFPQIATGFSDFHPELKGDIIITLGVISMHTSLEFYLANIHSHFLKIINEPKYRKILLNTLRFLFKARLELFNIEQCRNLLSSFLLDKDTETRKDSVNIINSIDFIYSFNIYLETLRKSEKREDKIFLLSSMNELLDSHYLTRDILDESLSQYFFKVLTAIDVEDSGILPLVTKLLCNLSQYSNPLTVISYAFLDSVLQGNNDHATSYVLSYFGKLIVQLQLNPNKYQIKMNYRQFIDEVKHFAENDQMPNSQISAFYTLTLLYNNDYNLGIEFYNFCYSHRNTKGTENRSTILKLLTNIACNTPEVFFKQFQEQDVRWLDPSRLELEILPLIMKNLDTIDKLEESVVYSVSLLTNTYGTSQILKEFLVQAIRKIRKSINQRVNMINCLIQIPDIEWDIRIIRKIISYTNSSNPQIREASLKALVMVLDKIKPLEKYHDITKLTHQRSVNLLINAIMQRKFARDKDDEVRSVFIRIARDIAIKNPDFNVPMLFIRDLGVDKSYIISSQAISAYFKYIKTYPEKLETTAGYLRLFANSKYTHTKNLILENITQLDYTGSELTYVLPTLLKLAEDSDSRIRNKSLKIYQEIYRNTTDKLFDFIELLVRVTRKKDPRIRIDSLNIISEIAFEFPEEVSKRNLVFEMFTQLSKDNDSVVKRMVSEKLENMIKIFPEHLNIVLRMLYSLIRESDRKTFFNCIESLRYVLLLYPEQRKIIRDAIQRFYKRTAHPALEKLLEEF
ncbi:MAG: hypothetical protein JW776_08025 [Candidatus Lokiarchaeota archaeon]|nr:hypothetical protein [Candidatus Lokiarchaeota archaeon]